MPFGRQAHVQGSATLETDFDSLYHELIKPAIAASGNAPLRIDEVIEAGDITSQYLNRIVSADLVIAELSMPNGNVYYELGIRQSLSARPNILMAEANTELPFDVRNQRVLFYRWSTEVERAKTISILTQWIGEVTVRSYANPVHQYLKLTGLGVDPSDGLAFERDFRGKIERAKTPDQLNAVWTWDTAPSKPCRLNRNCELSRPMSARWRLAGVRRLRRAVPRVRYPSSSTFRTRTSATGSAPTVRRSKCTDFAATMTIPFRLRSIF